MEKIFENKVALVTGASSGIGQAAALAFARRGAKVAVADIREPMENDTVSQINALGGEAMFIHCDVSKHSEVTDMIDKVLSKWRRLDFAFNNAGIEGVNAMTPDCTKENWERVLAVNLTGVWLCMKHELPHMVRQGAGAIVNCSSVAGLAGFSSMPAYVASKHGVVGLTRTAALEYAHAGIRINAVCPGVIKTAMVDRVTGQDPAAEKQFIQMEPIGRMGRPEEVAEAVIWLCSDGASFITGDALPVDGGWMAS